MKKIAVIHVEKTDKDKILEGFKKSNKPMTPIEAACLSPTRTLSTSICTTDDINNNITA